MTEPLDQPAARLRLVAAGSIAVAVAVTGFKFAAYWRSGSAALYSDAIESIVNLVTALVAFGAIHWALQPADRNHQFGHHKAEYFSAVIEGVLAFPYIGNQPEKADRQTLGDALLGAHELGKSLAARAGSAAFDRLHATRTA